jgi:hypothetical protein
MLPFIALLQDSDGLTFAELVRDIPHDLPAIIVYVMIGAFIFVIWRANRRRPQA